MAVSGNLHRAGDHTAPYAQGGPTTRANLALTCRRHNQTKTTGTGWTYHHNPDGSYTWTTHTGHHYTSPATSTWTRAQPKEEDPPPR
jgi:HNH endonuclease